MSRRKKKKLSKEDFSSAICPGCGRFMNKVRGWVCRKCGGTFDEDD